MTNRNKGLPVPVAQSRPTTVTALVSRFLKEVAAKQTASTYANLNRNLKSHENVY